MIQIYNELQLSSLTDRRKKQHIHLAIQRPQKTCQHTNRYFKDQYDVPNKCIEHLKRIYARTDTLDYNFLPNATID